MSMLSMPRSPASLAKTVTPLRASMSVGSFPSPIMEIKFLKSLSENFPLGEEATPRAFTYALPQEGSQSASSGNATPTSQTTLSDPFTVARPMHATESPARETSWSTSQLTHLNTPPSAPKLRNIPLPELDDEEFFVGDYEPMEVDAVSGWPSAMTGTSLFGEVSDTESETSATGSTHGNALDLSHLSPRPAYETMNTSF